MSGRLRVEGDEVGAGVGEVADDGIDRRHHQVDVNRRLDAVVLERLADHRADGEVGHVVVVCKRAGARVVCESGACVEQWWRVRVWNKMEQCLWSCRLPKF